ncbi:MAG: hypothetical protein E2O39_03015 [Planctomycetota bacterium]|nr:MAG: hypothetical protein E2O39_03015 [Planctomycetota bacterium]
MRHLRQPLRRHAPRPRALLLAAVLGVFASSASAQDSLAKRHVANARFERYLALQAAWEAADAEHRAPVLTIFRELATRGIPSVYVLEVALLTRMTRMLRIGDAPPAPGQHLVDALDLRPIPGVFRPGTEERGDPITVRIVTLYKVRPADEVELSLLWLGPDGREVRARTEPMSSSPDSVRGLEMYIHAPPSPPAIWKLVAEVRTPDGVFRGFPVDVECVRPVLDAAVDELLALDERSSLAAALIDRVNHGVRDVIAPPVSDLLAGAGTSAEWRRLGPLEGYEIGDSRTWVLDPERGRARQVLFVPTTSYVHPAWIFAGSEGRAWRALADGSGCRVIATDLPFVAAEGPSLFGLARALRAEDPALVLTLVARGPLLGPFQIAILVDGAFPFDRLVIATVHRRDRVPGPIAPVPTLFFESLDRDVPAAEVEGEQHGLVWVRRAAPPFAAECELPKWIGEWLGTLDGK